MPFTASTTDEELLDHARAGDSRAFRFLVERYEGKVAATVIGMLGRGQEADDVGQETFIRFFKSMEQFRGDASLGTYLTRIAINQSLKALKKRQTWRKRFFSRDDDESDGPEPVCDGITVIEDEERKALVHRSLERLNPEHRAVVVLRMLEGYSTRETAELLGVPEGTVMSRLSRGLGSLEKLLKVLTSD